MDRERNYREVSTSQTMFKLFAGQDGRTSGVTIKAGGTLHTFLEAVVGGGHFGNGTMTIQAGAGGWICGTQARVGGSDNRWGLRKAR